MEFHEKLQELRKSRGLTQEELAEALFVSRTAISKCDLLFGFTDLLSLMLIFLPLYSKPVDGYIYSVSLIEYVDNEIWIRMTYWGLFIALTIIGIVNILMVNFKFEKGKKVITFLSVGLSIITVLYLAIAREPYAVTVAFLLLLIKEGLLYKRAMDGR